MADTVADVHAAVRALVGADAADGAFDDDTLFPYTKIAYRKAARALRAASMGLFQKTSSDITVTAGGATISRSAAPTFPTDLLRPIRLREKPTGSTYFKPMNSSDGFIKDQAAQAGGLQNWDWRNDTILTGKCTVDSVVQVLYETALPVLTKPNDTILIPDGIDPIARMVASMIARSRDELTSAKEWWDNAMEDLSQIAASEKSTKAARGAAFGD